MKVIATVGEIDLNPDGQNVNVSVNWTDEEGTSLQDYPSVFTFGLEEMANEANLKETIRARSAAIQEEIERKAIDAAAAEKFLAEHLGDYRADLEDRSFDATDTAEHPVTLPFTDEQLKAKAEKNARDASAQPDFEVGR